MSYRALEGLQRGNEDPPASPFNADGVSSTAAWFPRPVARLVRVVDLGRASYRRDVAMTGIAQFAAAAGRIIYITLIAHAVGPKGLADASVVIALGTLFSLVTAAGVGPATTRRTASARARNQPNAVSATFYRTRRVAYLGLLVSASVGGVAYTIAFGELWIGLNLAAFVLAYGLYQYYWAVYYGLGLVSSYLRSEIRTDLLVVLVAPAVILARPLLILPFYLGYATFVVRAERDISQVLGRRSSRTTRARAGVDREDHELWRYALISAIGTAASMASLQLGVVISHQALGATLAGSYAAAYALILPLLYLPRTLSTALLPRAAAEVARGGHAAIRKQLGSLTDLLALVALPLCLAGIVLAHPILDLVSGSGYSDGVAPLRILLVAAFFLMVSVPAVNVLSAGTVSSLATPFYASVAGLLVCCAVWAAWLPRGGGLVAVAAGVLAGSVTKSVPPIAIAFRRYRVSGSFVGVTTLALIAGGAFGAQGGGMLAGAAVIGAGASVASVCFLTRLWNAKSDTP